MSKLSLIVVAAAVAGTLTGGCAKPPAPLREKTPTPPPVAVAPPAVGTQSTRPATAPTATRVTPPAGRVVEVITRPKLATRPSTTMAAATAARAGEAPISSADVPTPKLTFDDVKRIDTSISAAPLTRLLAMKLNNIPYTGFAGYGALDFSPALPEGTDPDAMTNDVLGREPSGTAGAINRLIKGEVDLVLVPRLPTPEETAAAGAAKARLRSDLVATEALVFTTNVASPVSGLSQDQLKKIFTAEAKTWKDLGEPTVPLTSPIASEPITVAYRARGTGSEELLRQLLLDGKPMPELPVSRALSATKLVLDASVEDPQTIGFSVFAYASNMKREGRVKVLAVDGIVPEPARVASGEYPLTTPIYVLTRADLGAETNLYKLRTWLGSMNGQKLLAEAGYMPVSSEAWTAVRLMGK